MDISQYPWSVLEIDPTDNVRAVKSAYAKKLKVTKPDEDAEGFQALNEAYKSACTIAENFEDFNLAIEAQNTKTVPDTSVGSNDVDPISDPEPADLEGEDFTLDLSPKPKETANPSNADFHAAFPDYSMRQYNHKLMGFYKHPLMQELMERLDALLADNPTFHHSEKWWFLFEHDEIFDQDFSEALSLFVLHRVVKHNYQNRQVSNRHMRINQNVMGLLDDHMHWRENIDHFLAIGEELRMSVHEKNKADNDQSTDQNTVPHNPENGPDLRKQKSVLTVLAAISGGESFPAFHTTCHHHSIDITATDTNIPLKEEKFWDASTALGVVIGVYAVVKIYTEYLS